MAIKAIIFDCFGVLVTSGRDALHRDYHKFSKEIHDLEKQSDLGIISREQFNNEVSKTIGLSPQEFELNYWHNTYIRNEKVFAWVRELKKDGEYKIGILSNIGKGWIEDFIPNNERNELFDSVVLSGEVGVVKPSIEAFEMIAKELGVLIEDCVMIDDIQSNINGAERSGMNGILFESVNDAKAKLDALLEISYA